MLPYYKNFVADWLLDRKKMKLSAEEKGIFSDLRAHAWRDPDCTIPADREELRPLYGKVHDENSIKNVLKLFEPHKKIKEALINRELFDQWEEALGKSAKAKRAGRKGGQAKAKRQSSERLPYDKQSSSHSDSDTDSDTKPETEDPLLTQVSEMADIWNEIMPVPVVPMAETFKDTPAVFKAVRTRIRRNAWVFKDFRAVCLGACDKYKSLIDKRDAEFLTFNWIAKAELAKLETLKVSGLKLLEKWKKRRIPKLPKLSGKPIAEEFWRVLSEAVVKQIGEKDFNIWFKPAEPLGMEDEDTAVIMVPNSTFWDYLENDYGELVSGLIEGLHGYQNFKIKYISNPRKPRGKL